MCITKKPSFTNQQINSIIVNENNDYKFVYFLLKFNNERIKATASGAATPLINKTTFSDIIVTVPPLKTQHKIAGVLSAYDDLIENNMRRIAILEEMAQRIYKEWFVDFKYPGHENDKLVDSELGMIPERWEVHNIGIFIQYYIGGGWGKEELSEEFSISGYVIRGTDIPSAKHGSIISCPQRYHKASNMKSRELKIGDIVFEVSGGSKDQPLGRAYLLTRNYWIRLVIKLCVQVSANLFGQRIFQNIFIFTYLIFTKIKRL